MLIDFVTDSVRQIVSEQDADLISRLAKSGRQDEKWLQGEVFKRFISGFPDNEMVREKPYPWSPSKRECCDFWCQEVDGGESWVELKTCATNYGSRGKNITQKIDNAIRDIARLKQLPSDAKRYVSLFLLAYPIPALRPVSKDDAVRPGPFVTFATPHPWLNHLRKFKNSGATVKEEFRIPIKGEPKYDMVGYVIAPLA